MMTEHANTQPSEIVILDLIPQSLGWLPVKHLVGLLQYFLDAEIISFPQSRMAALERIRFKLTRRRSVNDRPQLLVVAPRLKSITKVAAMPGWEEGFDRLSVWLIDSFWTDSLNRFSGLQNVDHLFITWGGDLEAYRAYA